MTMPVYSQHAPGATDDTACHTTNDATNSRTDRTGCAPALSCTALAAAHNALGLYGERHGKDGKNASRYDQSGLHE